MTDEYQVKLAQDILDEMVGAAGLTDDQLATLGWDVYKFGYYGRPTADENKEKAKDIVKRHYDEIKESVENEKACPAKLREVAACIDHNKTQIGHKDYMEIENATEIQELLLLAAELLERHNEAQYGN
jgi:hypothetical protein